MDADHELDGESPGDAEWRQGYDESAAASVTATDLGSAWVHPR